MKAVVAAFNQEKALVGAFSVITNLRMELFEALVVRSEVEVIRRRGVAGRVFAVVNINAKLQNYLQKIHLSAISLVTLKVN